MSSRPGVPSYDYVIVGAGTAGCALAARLAEDPGTTVALVEAGGPSRRILDVPLAGLWAWLRHPKTYCWQDWTVPQAALDGRRVWWPAGRLVGGSSAINAMMYSRGDAAGYDRWRLPGDIDWGYDALLPYFRRAEDQERGASPFHGAGGPIAVSDGRYVTPFIGAFLAGCQEAGVPPADDFNGARADGAGVLQVSQHRGRRASAAGYLDRTVGGPRVALHLRSTVARVMIAGGRAMGVVCEGAGAASRIEARREVIVSAGAVRSPQLLMLSGIGPAEALQRVGVSVVADRPGVGANLQDHVRIPVIHRFAGPRPTTIAGLIRAGADYVRHRRGLLTSNVCDAVAVVRGRATDPIPSLRVVCQWRALPEQAGAFVNFEVVLIDPDSRGTITLVTNRAGDPPAVDPGYLSAPADGVRLLDGVGLVRRIAASVACRNAGVREEVRPGGNRLDAHIRQQAASAYHAAGTCRLGADADLDAVVDSRLRVIGVSGLRVVDASVMPTTAAGNGMAPVLAIAERAADLIRGRTG